MTKDGYQIEEVCAAISEEELLFLEENTSRLQECGVLSRVLPKPKGSSEIDIYSLTKRSLTQNIPILANIGFSIASETSFVVKKAGGAIYCQKYYLDHSEYKQLKSTKSNLEDAINSTINGELTNSPLNELVYKINADVWSVRLLTAISAYARQLIADFSQPLIYSTLLRYYHIANYFLRYFEAKFDKAQKNRNQILKELEQKISEALRGVENINDDRVLSCFFAILKAMLRTNFFILKEGAGDGYRVPAFKISLRELSDFTDGVQPRIEAFVYSCEFEGVHLRRNRVSRGGIRWSDRYDDYRNEIRLLMQAQRQKNSIIIPSGAKGGFVIHKERVSREEFSRVYTLYINSLLDLVDNIDIESKKIVRNCESLTYDEDDAYFVVAADKGTSSMSDTANAIALKRGFWLGDAFASGGSNGYNHKEMGITAKGAIKSVERFFIEIGRDIYTQKTTVIGIGSPAGDVFGNGMLLSSAFALVGAISSKEIFIDPTPDTKVAFAERERLFRGNLGWSSYDKSLISEGGGVFKKSEKEIVITKEMKQLLGIKKDVLNGEELSKAVLCAKADMLFNGGVGTYVKASRESNTEIGDKPNESSRINAKDLKVFAICEGGNLGLSQKARLEFAKKGGKISADSIDNSAGVQTSDYEVNLKILLNILTQKSIISQEKRVEILDAMKSDVENIVLKTNYDQALALSLDSVRSRGTTLKIKETISVLEDSVDSFKREHFDIPGMDEFDRVYDNDGRVLRPVLSVLLSFSKIFLKSFLLRHNDFLESEFALHYLYKYFPSTFVALYKSEVESHPLKSEIIATYIANKVINVKGIYFLHDYKRLGDSDFLLKIKAFLVLDELILADKIRQEVKEADLVMPAKKQYDLLLELDSVVEFLTTRVLDFGEYKISVFDHFVEYRNSFEEFLLALEEKDLQDGKHISRFINNSDFFKMVLNIITTKEQKNDSFKNVAELFYEALKTLEIPFVLFGIKSLSVSNRWEEDMKLELQKELFETLAKVVGEVLEFRRSSESIKSAFLAFIENKKQFFDKYIEDLKSLKNDTKELSGSAIFVLINSLKRLG